MEAALSPLPDDVEALKALVAAMARKADEAEARLANAHARESAIEALIAHLRAFSDPTASDRTLQVILLAHFPSRQVIPPDLKML